MRKAWFRHKTIGYGVTPLTWEGWLCVLALVAAITATMVLTGEPSLAKTGAATVVRLRAELGLKWLDLPPTARLILVAVEVVLFALFARTRTAPDRL
jgi:hypothetical protein